ncbi:metallophosphoesterase [Pinisolibacter aquiterrae]|uniref:metallophosphoesterase n=1 Tax=Pinisolibacter aquiterrae TaxID=2815579 RepID=UPI001C3D799B|nr:metallophosphoesterase [Pinisolibacter aquiterrae]MBV5262426.1 metallophosphoesterase [Pinisolibacter aquiterrae]MCC8235789.1 metallophosphoesterase [Pinisolibacter aquiterrae]
MIKIIHVSDTHVAAEPHRLYGLDPRERLARTIADIRANHDDADLCVVTGDLAHWGEAEAYATFAALWDAAGLPVVFLIGNHDDREVFQASVPRAMVDDDGFVQGARRIGDLTCLFLDTVTPGSHMGSFCERRRARLARILAETSGDVAIFLHHPPLAVGIAPMDAIALADADALASVLEPHRARIRHLFFGHLHRPISGTWRGWPFSGTRGVNHQLALDGHLRVDGRPASDDIVGSREPPGYAVALIDDLMVVVHFVDVLDDDVRFSLVAEETVGRGYALGMDVE